MAEDPRCGNNTSCQLFTGFLGTGKTTELLRLKAKLDQSQVPTGGYVVFINFEEYIQTLEPASLSDVLRVLAFCLAREADRVCGLNDGTAGEAYLRAFFKTMKDALPKGAELKSVDFELFGATLMLELRNNPSIHEQVEKALRSRFQHFADECRTWIITSIKRIQAAVGRRAERFAVIADGLEKLDGLHEKDREAAENAAESLFVVHGEFLHLPCHVIYTFPVWLRFGTAQLGVVYDCEPLTLPMMGVGADEGLAGQQRGDVGSHAREQGRGLVGVVPHDAGGGFDEWLAVGADDRCQFGRDQARRRKSDLGQERRVLRQEIYR